MLSVAELIDKLVIEIMKGHYLRQRYHEAEGEEKAALYGQLMIANSNRSVISEELDRKLERVLKGEERNVIIKRLKTY